MKRTRGFTLLELMVALTVGGIAISSIYALGAASTRNFQHQMEVANTQTSLRMALNQVKRDIARAGYLATPNVELGGQACAPIAAPLNNPGVGRLAAFSMFANNVAINATNNNTALDPTGNNAARGFTTDDLRMYANYETTSEYGGVSMMGADAIGVSQNWHAFRRDFTNWFDGTGGFNIELFDEAFTEGRAVRIQTTRGPSFFSTVAATAAPAATGADARITLDDNIPAACASDITNATVAPVSLIRYTIQNAPANQDNASGDAASGAMRTGPVSQLVRVEVDPRNNVNPLPDNPAARRSVLDFAVGFNVEFVMNTATPLGAPDQYTPGGANSAVGSRVTDPAIVNANPERVRAVWVEIAARAPIEDPSFPWESALCSHPLGATRAGRCFQVFPVTTSTAGPDSMARAARVRVAQAEIFVPNVAYEGY